MKIGMAVKAKNLRKGDLVIVWTEGFPASVAAIHDIDEPWHESSHFRITFKHDAGDVALLPNERVTVFR